MPFRDYNTYVLHRSDKKNMSKRYIQHTGKNKGTIKQPLNLENQKIQIEQKTRAQEILEFIVIYLFRFLYKNPY